MVCTAGMAPGCGVDRALCPISVSSGLTADLTRPANQLVMALVTRPLTLAEIAHLPAVTYLVPPGGRWGWAGPRPTTSPAPGSSPARSSGPGKPGWSPLPGCSSSSACPSPAPAAQQARTVGHHEPRPGSRQSSASADLRDEGAGVRPAGAPRPGTTGYDSIRRKAPGRPPRRLAQPPHA